MANKPTRWTISLAIKEMQKEATVGHKYHTHITMVKIKCDNSECWGCREGELLRSIWWEWKLRQLTPLSTSQKTDWHFLIKLNLHLSADPTAAFLDICLIKWRHVLTKKTCAQIFIAALFVIKSQNMGRTKISFNGWINWYLFTVEHHLAIIRRDIIIDEA